MVFADQKNFNFLQTTILDKSLMRPIYPSFTIFKQKKTRLTDPLSRSRCPTSWLLLRNCLRPSTSLNRKDLQKFLSFICLRVRYIEKNKPRDVLKEKLPPMIKCLIGSSIPWVSSPTNQNKVLRISRLLKKLLKLLRMRFRKQVLLRLSFSWKSKRHPEFREQP